MSIEADRSLRLYHYNASPLGRKIVWYLTLRQIPYAEVKQPIIMPRPDLATLGVAYRRIPVLAIGKDVYCDTRIILRKLEEFFPEGKIGAQTPEGQAIQKLLEIWHLEGPLFAKAAQCIPPGSFKDPAFIQDRAQMTGRSWSADDVAKMRTEALGYVRGAFSFLEKLLADGRDWVIGTDKPSLVDIEAIYVVHWLNGLPGALPEDLVSASVYPKVFAWMRRFDSAVTSASDNGPRPIQLDGATAAKQIFEAGFAEEEGNIAASELLKTLRKGDQVELFPTDSGFNNKDRGKLLSLAEDEIVIALGTGLRLHTPRVGFRVRSIGSKM